MNRRFRRWTTLNPGHARSLRIAVHNGRNGPTTGEAGRQIGGQSRLATATFRINDDDLVQVLSVRRNQHRSVSQALTLYF
jgi:hypothetical protein